MKNTYCFLFLTIFFFILNSCATYQPRYKDNKQSKKTFSKSKKKISHTFYLIGDAGNAEIGNTTASIKALQKKLDTATIHTSVIFLGDNIYPAGMPKKEHKNRAFSEHQLNLQTSLVKNKNVNAIFIPGNHDWYASGGLKGLERQQKYIEEKLDSKSVFFPSNGCPLEKIKINDEVVVIAVDTEWYLTNWDKHPTINDDCEIKSRKQFFDEFESLIKKNASKTTIVALHHPMFTYGSHGGQYSLKNQLFPLGKVPLPVVGSLLNLVRKTGGISTVDNQHKKYLELQKRIVALSQYANKVIFVSGHDHNLQYIIEDNIPQIISGAGSKTSAARLMNGSEFSYGGLGYSKLNVFADGSSEVSFFGVSNDNELEERLFKTKVLPEDKKNTIQNYNSEFPVEKLAAIYSEDETSKSKFHKTVWGQRYRKEYSKKVNVPTVNLDTLFGGLKAIRKGGGHQSRSLRLINSEGKEYVMRALKKSAEVFLQTTVFPDQYIVGQFEDTFPENVLYDFFTGSHPYAPFTIGKLSDAVGIYHTNPTLYYIPKQNALGTFNSDHGDALYMIEERATSGHGDQKSFGYANKIISTPDFLKNLSKNENHILDQESYLKARLFDMLIGDWDRHADQWRWALFNENDKKVYRPIPRDRDQAFSIMGDGAFMSFATRAIPDLKMMEGFANNIRNVKGFNFEMYSIDMALLNDTHKSLWDAQVAFLQKNITEGVIDNAFKEFPKEVDVSIIKKIKKVLLKRKENLQDISDRYYAYLQKYAVIKGTNKDDAFVIERLPKGATKIIGYRIKKGKKSAVFYQRTFHKKNTKEIWVFGLDDEDTFEVIGDGSKLIPVRIVGGQNKDTYIIENGNKVHIYDFKSKKNNVKKAKSAKVRLTDSYEFNTYSYKKIKSNRNIVTPTVGYNPDDGIKIGVQNKYTLYGFKRNPFSRQHILKAEYYFATQGYDFNYIGEFANVIGNWNLLLEGKYTSPNYSINFFDFGNETINPNKIDDKKFDLDYNRVKLRTYKFAPSLIWHNEAGADIKIGISYEAIEVEETKGRYINTHNAAYLIENNNNFIGAEAIYNFENKNNVAFPTLGMQANLHFGYKKNIDKSKGFTYLIPSLSFDYRLVPEGQLVLATKLKAHLTYGESYEFYQAASLGASDGMRGYRNQRFTGKNAFYQITDLRLNLRQVKTKLIPLSIGVYTSLDYGRVWEANETSNKWHSSYGGGLFINAVDILSTNISAFKSDEGLRFAIGVGFAF